MKNITEFLNEHLDMEIINEKLWETKNWTYLYVGYRDTINFFNNHTFSPSADVEEIKDKFIVVTTMKNLNIDKKPLIRAWSKKYDEELDTFVSVLCSYGDIEVGKKIVKIGKLLDKGKISLKDISAADKNFKGAQEDFVDYFYDNYLTNVK